MKILLVYTNRNRNMAPPPVGLAFLVPPLKQQGHQVTFLDLMFAKDPKKALSKAYAEHRPDIVGLSIRNLDEQSMTKGLKTLEEIRPFVRFFVDQGIPTVLGGPAFTTLPEPMLEYMGADYGIAGQGEAALPKLLTSLEEGGPNTNIAGLTWKEANRIKCNPPTFQGYDGQSPEWTLVAPPSYSGSMFPATVVTKTGCPYQCSYCDAAHVYGDHFMPREVDLVLEEICYLYDHHGIRSFFLIDACFNSPVDHAKEILQGVIRSKRKLMLSATLAPVTGQFDREYFELYRRAGGLFTIFGVESFSEKMLQSYRKSFNLDDFLLAVELAHKSGVGIGLLGMFGGPGENDQTIDESVRVLAKVPFSLFAYGLGVRILPHTDLFETARAEGKVVTAEELLFPKFYLSSEIDPAKTGKRLQGLQRRYGYRFVRMLPVGLRMVLANSLSRIIRGRS